MTTKTEENLTKEKISTENNPPKWKIIEEKTSYILERRMFLSNWEMDFVKECPYSCTPRMEATLDKIIAELLEIKDEVDEELSYRIKLKFIVENGRSNMWYKIHNLFIDFSKRDYLLTYRQRELIDKYFQQVKRGIMSDILKS